MTPGLQRKNLKLLRALPLELIPSSVPISPELRVAASLASSILDVGCGSGAKTAALRATSPAFLLGIDVNPSAIAFAREKFGAKDILFRSANILKPPPLRRKFDVINLSAVLTCVVPRKSRQTVLRNCGALLARNGMLIISDFMQSWHIPEYRKRYEKGEKETGEIGSFAVAGASPVYYAHHFSDAELLEILARAYFETVSFRRTQFFTATHNQIDGFVLTAKLRR